MEMTTLDNVAIGMMLVLAFLGIIIVVWNCAKLEKRIEKLEKRTEKIELSDLKAHYIFPPPPYTEDQVRILRELLTEFASTQ